MKGILLNALIATLALFSTLLLPSTTFAANAQVSVSASDSKNVVKDSSHAADTGTKLNAKAGCMACHHR